MKTIKQFLSRVASWFASLSSPEGQKKLNHALVTAYDLLDHAMSVVEMIAAVTPTKADDEIVRLLKLYLPHIPVPAGPMNDEIKVGLIRAAAVSVLSQAVSSKVGVPNRTLNLAVELAYNAFKAGKGA